MPSAIARTIYRPSSVYGYTPTGRAGLISTLIANQLQGRVSRILGQMTTLRDYVLADDIGQFITRRVHDPKAPSGDTACLALCRPAAISEVIHLVERALGRRLMLEIDARPSNARHMSFLPSASPADWSPTPLPVGIARTTTAAQRALLGA